MCVPVLCGDRRWNVTVPEGGGQKRGWQRWGTQSVHDNALQYNHRCRYTSKTSFGQARESGTADRASARVATVGVREVYRRTARRAAPHCHRPRSLTPKPGAPVASPFCRTASISFSISCSSFAANLVFSGDFVVLFGASSTRKKRG